MRMVRRTAGGGSRKARNPRNTCKQGEQQWAAVGVYSGHTTHKLP